MLKKEILNILLEFVRIYKSIGDIHRERAYQKAYYTIKKLDSIPNTKSELIKYPNLGKGIVDKIFEYINTGKVKKLEEIKKEQKYIVNLTSILGIGPSFAKKLISQNIHNINELKKAYNSGKVNLTNAQILGIKYNRDLKERIPRREIDDFKYELKNITKSISPNLYFKITGSYRRGLSSSGDIDIILYQKDDKNYMKEVVENMAEYYDYIGKLSQGKYKFSGLFILNKKVRHIDILFVPMKSLYTAINYFTGSKEHNLKLREFAKKKGYKVSEFSLMKGDTKIPITSEKDLFDKIGLKYIAPKNR